MQYPQYQPPAQIYAGYTASMYRRSQRRGLWRCLSCGACTGLLFMASLALLCVATLLLYRVDPPPAVNILILGHDARPGAGEEKIARTDSIMIVSIDAANQRLSLLSIPRDLYLPTPHYGLIPVNTIVRNAELNIPGSGIQEMVATIEQTFGIQIDYYMRVNFEGFVDVVDALGGVQIDVPKRIVDNEYPTPDYGIMRIEFQPGKQKMDGATALIYARTRHADDDYQRAARQQQVIDAMVHKLANPANVRYWPGVWRAFDNNVESNMDTGEVIQIIPALILYGRNPDNIERLVIDRDTIIYSNNTSIPDLNKLLPWIQEHLVH